MKTLVLSIALLLVAIVLMGVKVLFVRGGRFPRGHAHDVYNRAKKQFSQHTPNGND